MPGLFVVELARNTTERLRSGLRAALSTKAADTPLALTEIYLVCLRQPTLLREMWEDAWKLFASGAVIPTEEHRAALESTVRDALDQMEWSTEELGTLRSPDRSLAPERLTKAAAAVRELLAEVEGSGPWFSAADREAAADRGDVRELDEAFAEVAGVSKEAWAERVRQQKEVRGIR